MRFTIDTTQKWHYGDKRNVVIFAWFPRLMSDNKTLIWLGRYVKKQRFSVWPDWDGSAHWWVTDSVTPYEPEETLVVDKIATFLDNGFLTTLFVALVVIPIMAVVG